MTPSSAPKPSDEASSRPAPDVDLEYARQVGTYLHYMNLALVANVVSAALFFAVPDLQDIVILVGLAVILGAAVLAVLLARMLHGTAWAVVCAPLMLVPGANVVVMLVLNRKATQLVRDAGFKVGPLGPSPEDLR